MTATAASEPYDALTGRSDRPSSSEEPPLPPVRPVRRHAIAIVAAAVLVGVLSGCSAAPFADGLERLSDNARELLGAPAAESPDAPSTAEPGEDAAPADDGRLRVSVPGLRVGDCIGEFDYETGLVELLPCDSPHIEEVYHEYRILESEFPGDDRVLRIAEDECRSAFEPYLGEPWEESDYAYTYWAPVEDTWIWGDRVILCTLYQPGVELGAPAGDLAA
jgi:Septum formation